MNNEINEKLQQKLEQGREYRNTQAMEIRAEEENSDHIVRGYATTFNEPYMLFRMDDLEVYEEIDASAFDECDMSDVIMQYDHEGRVFARLSNGTLRLNADNHGLGIEADLSGTEIGRQLYEEIKGGYTNKMSFGFIVGEDERTIVEDKENGYTRVNRKITKVSKLFDVSAVSLPANDSTTISARKFGEGVVAELKAERQRAEELEMRKQKIRILGGAK